MISLVLMVSGLSLLMAFVAFLTYDRIHYRRQLVRDLEILAEMIGSNCTASLLFNIPSDAEEIVSALKAHPSIRSGKIYTADGSQLTSYRRSDVDSLQSKQMIQKTVEHYLNITYIESNRLPHTLLSRKYHLFLENRLALFHPVVLDNELIGMVYLETDLTAIEERFQNSITAMAAVMLISFLVIYLLTAKLQYFITKPISYLSLLAKRVSTERDYSIRADKFSKDEIGLLIESFNDMLSQIEYRDNTIQETSVQLEKQTEKLKNELKKRRKVEKEIKRSLDEKNILLQEIHHRVKNNLQIISSLLKLQLRHIDDPDTMTLFQDCHNRVHTMALIHEQLYRSEDFSNIDFQEYVLSLTKHLFYIYNNPTKKIKLEIEMEKAHLDLNTAIPCGLLITELVSNSLKYAFIDRDQGKIKISLARVNGAPTEDLNKKKYIFTIQDDGVGLPSDIESLSTESLGLKLVNALVRQLRGEISVEINGGTIFTIEFIIE
ncbi:HAMP domain-containing protein [bacterium]|nr:HAMP domain-containing protein [bacterium]